MRERELRARRVTESRRVFGSEEEPSCGQWHQTGLTVLIMCIRDNEGQIAGFKGAGCCDGRAHYRDHALLSKDAFDGSKSKWTSEAALHLMYLHRPK